MAAGDAVFGARHFQDIGVAPAPGHTGHAARRVISGSLSGAARRRRDSSS